MDIQVEGTNITGAEKLTNVDQVVEGVRLFYELGIWREWKGYRGQKWELTGKFKEIMDPIEYSKDSMFTVLAWCSHHNFVILKSEQ